MIQALDSELQVVMVGLRLGDASEDLRKKRLNILDGLWCEYRVVEIRW